MNMTINPEVVKLETEANSLLTQSKQYAIKSGTDYENVSQELMKIKGVRKQVDAIFDPVISKAHETHKEALSSKKKLTDPLDTAERGFKQAMITYNNEQERIARAEQDRLRRIAQEQARIEREKLEKQAMKAIEQGKE
ncbi:MAG TPA: hypothetical protein VMW91_01425, partial [Desulfosporosinus sp.]|nr:hypothetical protein [Desulfosporosinus sp.]